MLIVDVVGGFLEDMIINLGLSDLNLLIFI